MKQFLNQILKTVALPVALAAPLAFSSVAASAEEIDLVSITASISAALDDVAAESQLDNEFALPLRTNAELADISAMCDFVLSLPADDLSSIPSICDPTADPAQNEMPFAGDLDNDFGYQYSHYLTDDAVSDTSFLLVRDFAKDHYNIGG